MELEMYIIILCGLGYCKVAWIGRIQISLNTEEKCALLPVLLI